MNELHAHDVTAKYRSDLGFLVRMSDGTDYGRDPRENVARDVARSLGGNVFAYGVITGERIATWHLIVPCTCEGNNSPAIVIAPRQGKRRPAHRAD
jgi:hypothetical protein